MKREQTTIRLPEELYKELTTISQETGLTVSSLLIVSMWRHVLKLKS